jgi:AraC-like DNA-binding protein
MFIFDDRVSDSPFIERIWRARSTQAGTFLSVAANHFEMVVTRYRGKSFITMRGPETRATSAECPFDGEWFGIRFALGAFMPRLIPGALRDRRDVTLPDASRRSFWLNGSAWEYPDFDNADTFVKRLVRKGLVIRDPGVDALLRGERLERSLRSAQRHFLRATGLTRSTVRQIDRARYATSLLKDGVSILDVVHAAGYYDQAHLTRSLKHRIGQTPGEIIRADEQLSFLYKTPPLSCLYDYAGRSGDE